MFVSLGLTDEYNDQPVPVMSDFEKASMDAFAYGDYKTIIQTLFKDGFSYGDLQRVVTQNSDPAVVSFVNNFLFKELDALPSCTTDEDAFASIIPRSVSTEAELRPYLDNLKNFIKEYREANSSSSDPETPNTD